MILLTDSEGPDQTAHMRSLIRAFAVRAFPGGTISVGATHLAVRMEMLYHTSFLNQKPFLAGDDDYFCVYGGLQINSSPDCVILFCIGVP